MSRRALLALSAASTAFILVIAGAVASYALPRAQPSPANTRLPGNPAVLSAIARPEPQPAVSGPVFERLRRRDGLGRHEAGPRGARPAR